MDTLLTEIMISQETAGKLPKRRGRSAVDRISRPDGVGFLASPTGLPGLRRPRNSREGRMAGVAFGLGAGLASATARAPPDRCRDGPTPHPRRSCNGCEFPPCRAPATP